MKKKIEKIPNSRLGLIVHFLMMGVSSKPTCANCVGVNIFAGVSISLLARFCPPAMALPRSQSSQGSARLATVGRGFLVVFISW